MNRLFAIAVFATAALVGCNKNPVAPDVDQTMRPAQPSSAVATGTNSTAVAVGGDSTAVAAGTRSTAISVSNKAGIGSTTTQKAVASGKGSTAVNSTGDVYLSNNSTR